MLTESAPRLPACLPAWLDIGRAALRRRLKMLFGLAGLPAAGELHGDMTQAARLESLDSFRKVGERGVA